MLNDKDSLRRYISNSIEVKWNVSFDCADDILAAAKLITQAFKNGNKLLLCGNGGSAADCQHMAAEFVPMGLPAIALTTDTSAITALGNDIGFDKVFSKQVEAIGTKSDVLLVISTSGKSANVKWAAGVGKFNGLSVIALTGENGLLVVNECDVNIKVPSTNTQHIQEAHAMIEHILWQLVKEAL